MAKKILYMNGIWDYIWNEYMKWIINFQNKTAKNFQTDKNWMVGKKGWVVEAQRTLEKRREYDSTQTY